MCLSSIPGYQSFFLAQRTEILRFASAAKADVGTSAVFGRVSNTDMTDTGHRARKTFDTQGNACHLRQSLALSAWEMFLIRS